MARERVYHFGKPTPLDALGIEGLDIWIKREDISPIKAYKWRGAANRMASLSVEEKARGVATASAGNHAQGVALAAARLGVFARIYMPRSTPRVKIEAVRRLGGEQVEVILSGDSYDEAMAAALSGAEASGATYVHAYDDLKVMAGQGTLADEVVLSGQGPFDVAYLQIGGGGMAAGVSEWLKTYWPEIEIVGVEGIDQACMGAAATAGEPVTLDQVDLFCDGTAVRKIGSHPFKILQSRLDRLITVTNDEVVGAIRCLWEGLRCIAEPSGAMGLAGALKESSSLQGKRVLVVLCGANIDFLKLGQLALSQTSGRARTRTLSVRIPERPGAMLQLLHSAFAGANIVDFQYGKTSERDAWPVFTLQTDSTEDLDAVSTRLNGQGFEWRLREDAVDVRFRAIPLRQDLLSHPVFLRLDFYEREGALRDFLRAHLPSDANLCYFNYRSSGERIGRALIGIEFPSSQAAQSFLEGSFRTGEGYRLCEPLDPETTGRLLGQGS
nr:pyridoxal-phosphate dependent enzyme [Haloferula luteola]